MKISRRGAMPSTMIGIILTASLMCAHATGILIDAGRRSDPVGPYEYGMFIEPIGGLIARSLWAEMLDDRKFYYAIAPEREDSAAAAERRGPPGNQLSQVAADWRRRRGHDG